MRGSWVLLVFMLQAAAVADGPQDNLLDNVSPVPPPGIKVPDADREELDEEPSYFAKDLETLKSATQGKAELASLVPDVEIFYKAVHDALKYDEIFNVKEITVAKKLLAVGRERASDLTKGEHPWTKQTGASGTRFYRSKIGESVQHLQAVDHSQELRFQDADPARFLVPWPGRQAERGWNFIQSCAGVERTVRVRKGDCPQPVRPIFLRQQVGPRG